MSTVLVTGAAGYIAGTLIPALVERGDLVIALDCHGCPDELVSLDRVVWVRARLSDTNGIEAAFSEHRPDLCFHLARPDASLLDAYTPEVRMQQVEQYDMCSRIINACVDEHISVFEAAVKYNNVPVIFSSSDSVYGPNSSSCVLESSPAQPISMNGLFNFMLEQYARFYSTRYGVKISAIRMFNVYGYWREGWRGDVVSRFCQAALATGVIDLYGDGHQQRDFVYIDDVVGAMLALSEHMKIGFHVFNLATGRGTSLKQLIATLESLTGCRLRINSHGFRFADLNCAVGSAEKLHRISGVRPEVGVVEGLRRTLSQSGVITMRRSFA